MQAVFDMKPIHGYHLFTAAALQHPNKFSLNGEL